MSHQSKVFTKVPVKVQERSGFDLSHENYFTATCGTLTPCLVEEVLPGDKFSIGNMMQVKLPPLATDFYGRVDARVELFFVPNRLLWAGWQNFITSSSLPTGSASVSVTSGPTIRLTNTQVTAGSLADMLGVKGSDLVAADVNALPFLAYHKIWDDWYRDSLLQNPCFCDGVATSVSTSSNWSYWPMASAGGSALSITSGNYASAKNNFDITALHQRNWAKDYFTTCTTRPQNGAASSLQFSVDGDTGEFSIASLRAANALQKWLERNNIAGNRYYDQILAHFGVVPSDATFQRSLFLGSINTPVVINSVNQTTPDIDGTTYTGANPFEGVGSSYGKANCFNKDTLVDSFEAKEHGYLIALFSLVPHANYSTGCKRYLFNRNSASDYAWPEFAGIGDQAVYRKELFSGDTLAVFGYNQRYSEYKYHDDEVHGLFRDGQSLDAFALQRSFDGLSGINSEFIQISTNYMDGVLSTTSGVSGMTAMVDCYFSIKALRTLPEYSLPCLN